MYVGLIDQSRPIPRVGHYGLTEVIKRGSLQRLAEAPFGRDEVVIIETGPKLVSGLHVGKFQPAKQSKAGHRVGLQL
eukprot:scaffold26501_cov35-Tisochrysis_lutea.AAC.2